jgi:hypothetical protein
MRIHAKIHHALAVTPMLLLGPTACNEELLPETYIWLASEPRPETVEDGLACELSGVVDGEGISIRHQLPRNVETDLPVQILVETPCTSTTSTMKHDTKTVENVMRGVAETTVVAPPGAACNVSITVEIANDRQVCSSAEAEAACQNLDEVCADALADDPERATTTQ